MGNINLSNNGSLVQLVRGIKYFLCLVIVLCSCKGKEAGMEESVEVEEMPVVIQISDALLHPQKEILLSELADSVSYIPLETKKECLLGNYPFFSFTSRYIAYLNYCFDWSGKFLFKVGKLGQGPGEEPGESIGEVTFCDGNFYTKGQKIIEYDSCGHFTGKELSLYSVNKSEGKITGNLYNVASFKALGDKLIIYNYPDTIFVMNKNMEIDYKHFVMPWNTKEMPYFLSLSSPYDCYMNNYKEDILFYNYFNDTVFQISGINFNPKWVIKLDDLKLPELFLYEFNNLYGIAAKDYHNGQLENTPLIKQMDHKYMVTSVNESDNYVFIIASEIIAFSKLRKLPQSSPILICYNKKTKQIKSTTKIKDDLTGYPNFFPKCGLEGERMLDFFWPYEQEEWLKKKAEADPKFSRFADRDFSEDNPIIVVAHLKK